MAAKIPVVDDQANICRMRGVVSAAGRLETALAFVGKDALTIAATREIARRDEAVKARFTTYFDTPCGSHACADAGRGSCLQRRETIPENRDSLPASGGVTAFAMIATPQECKTDLAGTAFAKQR